MRKIVLIVWSLLVISSCTEDENPSQESLSSTIIVYMVADNDLAEAIEFEYIYTQARGHLF
jgi:hypothetical protein